MRWENQSMSLKMSNINKVEFFESDDTNENKVVTPIHNGHDSKCDCVNTRKILRQDSDDRIRDNFTLTSVRKLSVESLDSRNIVIPCTIIFVCSQHRCVVRSFQPISEISTFPLPPNPDSSSVNNKFGSNCKGINFISEV